VAVATPGDTLTALPIHHFAGRHSLVPLAILDGEAGPRDKSHRVVHDGRPPQSVHGARYSESSQTLTDR
jgi:hypothetical protein